MMLAFGSRCCEIFGKLDSVARHAIQRDVRRVLPVTTEGATRAALIPLHDREVRLVRRELRRERRERYAGAAVNMQQDRVLSIVAADRDPLLEPADGDEARFLDALALAARSTGAGGRLRSSAGRKRQ